MTETPSPAAPLRAPSPTARLRVDIWSDVACPWCYIGKRRFEAALSRVPFRDRVDVSWHSFQLDPGLPEHYDGTELDYLAERKGLPREQVLQMFEQVSSAAAGEGLEYDFDAVKVANTWTAHRLLHLAAEHGAADALKEALLSGHFEHGLDLGSRDELLAAATAAGLPGDAVVRVLDTDAYADAVREDVEQARALGIGGVPFFVLDMKYGVSGAQSAEALEQALTQAWSELPVLQPAAGSAAGAACGVDGCD
ncbi:DsbA family oxidoreductase [Zhihengliuella sp.]|uniref:DsbA family oxidoreductase n=1 Tax=Zhihengliuella sp. TaxID=1954483 RepID=UPI002811778D|nr:DsbA family oxidoreductase [Zhihengliuella sp.]